MTNLENHKVSFLFHKDGKLNFLDISQEKRRHSRDDALQSTNILMNRILPSKATTSIPYTTLLLLEMINTLKKSKDVKYKKTQTILGARLTNTSPAANRILNLILLPSENSAAS